MAEIEVDWRPKIFDDPEYCHGENRQCEHLNWTKQICRLSHEFNDGYKLPECKTAYQKAKGTVEPTKPPEPVKRPVDPKIM